MVATLLRMRTRITIHQFKRDWWRLLFVVAGAIWSLSIIPTVLVGGAALAERYPELKEDTLAAIAAILGLGWIVVPVLVTGVEDTLDPRKFAAWGIGAKRLMPGLAVAAITTVPALFTLAVSVVLASTWRLEARPLVTLPVALLGALLTAAAWIFSARVATMWASRVLSNRTARAFIPVLIAVAIPAVVVSVRVIQARGVEEVLGDEVALLLDQFGRTPIAAGLSAPAAIVAGDDAGALWRIGLMVVWVVLLYLAWKATVARALVTTESKGSGSSRRANLIAGSTGSVTARLWGRPVAAVRARMGKSWRSDPRYLSQLGGTLALPLFVGAIVVTAWGTTTGLILVVPTAMAVTIGWGRHNDLAFDSTAMWLDLVSGVRGRDLLWGRLLATVSWSLPVVAATALVCAGVSGRWEAFPAALCAAIGALGASLGVAAITSIAFPYKVPGPGESPFSADAGSIGASLGAQAVSSLATGLVVPFVTAPLLLALYVGGAWLVIAPIVGIALGPFVAWWATTLAGRMYDSRAGRLLTRIA